jgi:ankyrin repeat protein
MKGKGLQRIRKPSKQELLILAIQGDETAIARRLMREGADPNLPDAKGRNALWHAAHWARSTLVRDLVQKGVKMPDDVLMGPVQVADVNLVRFLIRHGANVNCVASFARFSNRFPRKQLLLTAAIERANTNSGGEQIPLMLIKAGAELNQMAYPTPGCQDFNWPLIGRAAHAGLLQTVKAMIDHGANVNMRDTWGGSALLDALAQGHQKVAEFLLRSGAEVHVVRRDGATPLAAARKAGLHGLASKFLQDPA